MTRIRASLTYANVMATVAVFLALGGGAYAALKLPKNSVGTNQIKKNAVRSSKVKNRSLLAKDFKLGQLRRGPRGRNGATNATVRTKNLVLHYSCTPFGPGQFSCQATQSETATCKPGERSLGGGWGKASDGSAVTINESKPSPTGGRPTGWTVNLSSFSFGPNSTHPDNPVPVYAICAAP